MAKNLPLRSDGYPRAGLAAAAFIAIGLVGVTGSAAQACNGISPRPDGVLWLNTGRGIAEPCAGRPIYVSIPATVDSGIVSSKEKRDRVARKKALDAQASQPPLQDNHAVSDEVPHLRDETARLKDQMVRLNDETAKLRAETARLKDQLARREAPAVNPADAESTAPIVAPASPSRGSSALAAPSGSKTIAPAGDHAITVPSASETAPAGNRDASSPDLHASVQDKNAVERAWLQLRDVAGRMKKDLSGH